MLSSPSETKAIIAKYGFVFHKRYGQNFLVDSSILDKIIRCSEVTKDDTVLEIGPGIGTMTQRLCEAAGRVIVVEIDEKLIPILEDTLSGYDNVEIVRGDILKVDITSLIQAPLVTSVDSPSASGRAERPKIKVVANLPYYITTPVIMGLLEGKVPMKSITVMVQKEVADRMCCGPGSKDYGALSLAVRYYSKPEIVGTVPPSCFMPPPKVESAVIRLNIYDESERPVKVKDEELLFRVIRASFNQRRKTLLNGLANGLGQGISKEQTAEAIKQAGFPENIRGEALSLEEFGRLSDILVYINTHEQ